MPQGDESMSARIGNLAIAAGVIKTVEVRQK
jgi:hypothetical protein